MDSHFKEPNQEQEEITEHQESEIERIVIPAPNFMSETFRVDGTAPYVQHRFSVKERRKIADKHKEGSTASTRTSRAARNFKKEYEEAMYVTEDGHHGIPATAFRQSMISACRVAGFVMARAKLAVFVEADSLDKYDGTPLVRIYGRPSQFESHVRIQRTTSVVVRPMWKQWHAFVKVNWDADQFRYADVFNLLMRAGMQVGVGEGRPDSKASAGMGLGTFTLEMEQEK